jgi:hypothetical protein
MLMHFCYTVEPSFIDSILKAIKNEMGFEGLRELEMCLPSQWCCICAYSRLVCTIDTSSRINAKLGGVNALPRSQPSVASLVWSYDRFVARYEATMLIQHPPIIDTAVVATCPSLFSSSSCYSVSSSLLQVDSSLDTPLCVVFYTVTSVDGGDGKFSSTMHS